MEQKGYEINTLMDIIDILKTRPGILVYMENISYLKAFFNGLEFGNSKLVENCDLLDKFEVYIQEKYGNSNKLWSDLLILNALGDEMLAFENFILEFDDFLLEKDNIVNENLLIESKVYNFVSLAELINEIELSPIKFLGKIGISYLSHFLGGFFYDLKKRDDSNLLTDFRVFIMEKYNDPIVSPRSWPDTILSNSDGEEDAFRKFFVFFREFLELNKGLV